MKLKLIWLFPSISIVLEITKQHHTSAWQGGKKQKKIIWNLLAHFKCNDSELCVKTCWTKDTMQINSLQRTVCDVSKGLSYTTIMFYFCWVNNFTFTKVADGKEKYTSMRKFAHMKIPSPWYYAVIVWKVFHLPKTAWDF